MIKSLLHYSGSKVELEERYQISDFIPNSNSQNVFVSCFMGSAVVELNHIRRSGRYGSTYLSDINADLINFWNVIRNHREEFEERLAHLWLCDDINCIEFKDDNLDQAARFYLKANDTTKFDKPIYLQKNVSDWTDILNTGKLIIMHKSYEDVLRACDKMYKRLLIYADPPYSNTRARSYKSERFDEDAFVKCMLDMDRNGHQILISYIYRDEFIQKFPSWFSMKLKITHQFGITQRDELLLSNRPFQRHNNTSLCDFL